MGITREERRTMNKTAAVAATLFITIALTGCGSTSEPIKTQAPTITRAVVLSATDSANGIKSKVSSVEKVVTLTEATDVNNLLGRPNGYTSAAVLYDKVANGADGIKCDDPKVAYSGPGVQCGATVEVWASENAAKARAAYIQNIGKSHPAMVEYDYLRGNTLLRVTGAMKPSAARQYNNAFGGALQ
jgi:hypothetical protein